MTDPVRLDYSLDVAGAGKLEKRLITAVPEPDGTLIVDLSECSFVASSGLRVLLKKAQNLAREGGALILIGVKPIPYQAMKISKFDTLMEIHGSEEEETS